MSTLKYSDFKISPIFPDVMTSQAENLAQECSPHFHLGYDITLVTTGVLKLKVGNLKRYYSENQLCIINPGMVHCGEGVGGQLLSTKNLRIKPEFMLKVAKIKFPTAPNTLHFDTAPVFDPSLTELFLNYFELSRSETSSPQKVSDTGWDLFTALVEHSCDASPSEFGKPVHGMNEIDLMHEKVREKINIPDLAARMNLSEYYFIKKFKKQYGITPYRFFMQVKLESAFSELMNGKQIKEVAHEFGYSDQAHFNRLLKKHYGYTPVEVRKIKQEVRG
ncbi:AraC family transcriptional regulator [Vibrio spartinae]|uniref:HTH-type transcriptional regulator YesS n=1 Tax=Vibrio spartinae TaxID=1918945 RepID=A0A1N6M8W3_9VIBR|nr:AraC family transcriptional regulator [Vibrio spartinae]SIO95797.1 HTH-type transcriptional regulator YesS [Vibrio spartinae]